MDRTRERLTTPARASPAARNWLDYRARNVDERRIRDGVAFFSLHLTNSNKRYKPYLYVVSTLLGVFSIVVFAVLAV